MCASIASAICPSPAAPGTSDGFTESMEMRSLRRERTGSLMSLTLKRLKLEGLQPFQHHSLYHAPMDLSGRVAVITGASSGIGLATARHLAREGVAVVIGARRRDRLDEAVAEMRGRGGRAEALVGDVTSESDVQRLVEHACRTFGQLDIMVCNAGFGYYGTVEETPTSTMQRMMDVNFMGTFYGARAALPHFRARGRGHLIIVSSIVGQRGIAMMSGYSATKAAQVAFAESLRTEFNGTGIAISV